jgi:septum formation protein
MPSWMPTCASSSPTIAPAAPRTKALGIAILERIDSSDPTALTGLPLIALTGMLRKAGVTFFNL